MLTDLFKMSDTDILENENPWIRGIHGFRNSMEVMDSIHSMDATDSVESIDCMESMGCVGHMDCMQSMDSMEPVEFLFLFELSLFAGIRELTSRSTITVALNIPVRYPYTIGSKFAQP